MFRVFVKAVCCAVFLLSQATLAAAADSWPSKPIKLVVPYPPGGATDVTARLLGDKLGAILGQTVIVENKAGAGANIGADYVAKSAPDGYTLLMATSTHTTNPSLYKKLPYDFEKDLAPVSRTAFIPNVLVVSPKVPVSNLAEFITYVKSPDKKLNFGSAGNGSSQHLSAALFNSMVGSHMVHVPYKGGAPAMVDLIGGQIQVYFGPIVEVISYIKSGKVKPIAVTTRKRSAQLPGIPTIGEALPGYEIALWNGIFAPAHTPAGVIDTLNHAILKVLDDPDTKARFTDLGSEPAGDTPAEFKQFVAAELKKWKKLVQISGAKIE